MKLIIFLFFIGSLVRFPLHSENHEHTPNQIAILTVPKSGTGLLAKAIFQITKQHPILGSTVPIGNNLVLFHHLWPGLDPVRTSADWKKIIFLRDPRDMLISMMYWIEKTNDWGGGIFSSSELDSFHSLSHDEKITALILLPERLQGAPYFIKTALKWIQEPDVNAFYFEDFVGEQGGGDRNRQINSILKLSKILCYSLSEEEILLISDDLFGNTATFRNGIIGAWKHEFKESHKLLFKEHFAQALIELGYESDDQW